MKLAVGFIMYNESSAKYLADFLPSLAAALKFLAPTDYQVYAWDNSFNDEAVNRKFIESFNKPAGDSNDATDTSNHRPTINYQTQGLNLGFSRAYNILIGEAIKNRAEYFLMLNPDMVLETNAIAALVRALDNDASSAAVSPKILRWDFARRAPTRIIDSLGLILQPGLEFRDLGQGQEDRGQFDKAEIIGPSGAAGLWRVSALIKIAERPTAAASPQYFDERFFMYKEDCDLAYRLLIAGYISRLVPEAIIYHDRTAVIFGQGLWCRIVNRRQKSRPIRSWSFRNQHLIFVKHWKSQNNRNRVKIVLHCLSFLVFSLILEQFILKEYPFIWRSIKPLTNIK